MNAKIALRILILLEFILAVGPPILMDYGFFELPPPLAEWNDYQADEHEYTPDWFMLFVITPMLLGGFVSRIGLFFYRRWAAYLYLVTTAVLGITHPLLGPHVRNGVEGTLSDTAMLVTGMIIAIAFFGNVLKQKDDPNKQPETFEPEGD